MKAPRSSRRAGVILGSEPHSRSSAGDRLVRYPTARSALKALVGATPESLDRPPGTEARIEITRRNDGKLLASRLLQPIVAQVFAGEPRTLVLKSRSPAQGAPIARPAPPEETLSAASALGVAVRQRRQALTLTQQQLADRAVVGRRFIVDLERGKPTLEIGKVLTVTQALGLVLTARVADDG